MKVAWIVTDSFDHYQYIVFADTASGALRELELTRPPDEVVRAPAFDKYAPAPVDFKEVHALVWAQLVPVGTDVLPWTR